MPVFCFPYPTSRPSQHETLPVAHVIHKHKYNPEKEIRGGGMYLKSLVQAGSIHSKWLPSPSPKGSLSHQDIDFLTFKRSVEI